MKHPETIQHIEEVLSTEGLEAAKNKLRKSYLEINRNEEKLNFRVLAIKAFLNSHHEDAGYLFNLLFELD